MEYKRQSHCVYNTLYHLVFVTKYRRKIFIKNIPSYLMAIFKNIEKKYPELEIIEMNTDLDHIHLLMVIPPKYSVSETVRVLKTNSARAMKKKFNFIQNLYEFNNASLWSPGYFVSTSGSDKNAIRKYIQQQGKEDKGKAQLRLL